MSRAVSLPALAAIGLLGLGCAADPTPLGAPSRIWVADQSGLVTSAFNGAWETRRPGGGAAGPLRAMVAIDDELGLAVGDGGIILATRDGGASWAPVPSSVTLPLLAVAFADAGRGYAAGDGVILRTTDAGATWSRLSPGVSGTFRGVAAAPSSGLVLVAGKDGTILRSTDGGDSFERVAVPTSASLNAIVMADDETNALAAGDAGVVLSSSDRGTSWSLENRPPFNLRAIALSGDSAVAVGDGGAISRWAGGSWTSLGAGTSADLAAVKFDRGAPGFGWAVGASGTVLYTTDGGAHFHHIATPLRGDLTAVEDF